MPDKNEAVQTSIGFGNGGVVVVSMPLDATRKMVEEGLRSGAFITIVDTRRGDTLCINPRAVICLQVADA